MNGIILLAGKSGSGKSSVVEYLYKKYGLREVLSYTTRPKRSKNDNTHIFVTDEEFDRIPEADMVAYTEFAGYRYCATKNQVENADIYVIDPDGILEFLKRYHSDKEIFPIYLSVSKRERMRRMLNRGDSVEMAEKRILNDDKKFLSIHQCPHATIYSDDLSLEETAEKVYNAYQSMQK